MVKERTTSGNTVKVYKIMSGMKKKYYSDQHNVRMKGHQIRLSNFRLMPSILKRQNHLPQEAVEAKTLKGIKK